MRSIVTGKEAEKGVDVDEAKKIGENIIAANCSKAVSDVVFQKANQATIMSSKSTALKIGDEVVHVDSQLLFQRMSNIVGDDEEQQKEVFKHELNNIPAALFDSNGMGREPKKFKLKDHIWPKTGPSSSLPSDLPLPIYYCT